MVQCGQANFPITRDPPLFKRNLYEGVQHVLVFLRLHSHLTGEARERERERERERDRERERGVAQRSCAGSGPFPRAWSQLPVDCVLLLGGMAGAALSRCSTVVTFYCRTLSTVVRGPCLSYCYTGVLSGVCRPCLTISLAYLGHVLLLYWRTLWCLSNLSYCFTVVLGACLTALLWCLVHVLLLYCGAWSMTYCFTGVLDACLTVSLGVLSGVCRT